MKDRVPIGSGTGFFYRVALSDDRFTLLLVTNKHVLDGANGVDLVVHLADSTQSPKPSGKHRQWQIDFTGTPIQHPDSQIDLCCVSVSELLEPKHNGGFPAFAVSIDRTGIPSKKDWESFDAIETVTMVGCPRAQTHKAVALSWSL